MNRLLTIPATSALAAIMPAVTAVAQPQTQKPNIVLILCDDMGYSDIGCFGGEIPTPNIDGLAERGVRFTQFYNTARSCPSRASLLTGLHPAQTGVGHMTHLVYEGEAYQGYLNSNCITLADVAHIGGYTTNMSGKWHVGIDPSAWPTKRGFDNFFGIRHWVDSYYRVLEGCEIYEGEELAYAANSKDNILKQNDGRDWYTTDVFTDKAIEQIDKSKKERPDNPFFLYLAYNAPHWPLEAHDDIIAKYIGKYSMGWSRLIEQKTERMKQLDIIGVDEQVGSQSMIDWDSLSDDNKINSDFRRAIYAAQITIVDNNVGRLIDYLKKTGQYDNTVIIFMSDNGCSAEPENNPFGYCWNRNRKSNYKDWKYNSERQGASQGMMWAIASNAPFRYYKKFVHEGGIATPFIISYPNGNYDSNSLNNVPCYLPDIMATVCDLAGVIYPKSYNGHKITECTGRSIAPVLSGKGIGRHKTMYWEHEGHGAIREGDWKLVTTDIYSDQWELYDLSCGRNENVNLATQYPHKVKRMKSKWEKWAYQTNVLPRSEIKKR